MNASTIKPGDRVRINAPGYRAHGGIAYVAAAYGRAVTVVDGRLRLTLGIEQLLPCPRMSLPARTLLAAWHASDRKLAKITDNVCGLHRIRRYGVTAGDGLTADLTLTTEVQL